MHLFGLFNFILRKVWIWIVMTGSFGFFVTICIHFSRHSHSSANTRSTSVLMIIFRASFLLYHFIQIYNLCLFNNYLNFSLSLQFCLLRFGISNLSREICVSVNVYVFRSFWFVSIIWYSLIYFFIYLLIIGVLLAFLWMATISAVSDASDRAVDMVHSCISGFFFHLVGVI